MELVHKLCQSNLVHSWLIYFILSYQQQVKLKIVCSISTKHSALTLFTISKMLDVTDIVHN